MDNAYIRRYMREYQRKHRDPETHRTYMRIWSAGMREESRRLWCPICETSWTRARYERRPVCPGCGRTLA